jgi:hypothetical protein
MRETRDVDFIISFPDDMDYETYANNYFALALCVRRVAEKAN